MADRRSRLKKSSTQRLKYEAKWLFGLWAILCLVPLWVVYETQQERSMRLELMESGVEVTAAVTEHVRGRSCAMYFTYYWKKGYETSYSGCPIPVGKAFPLLINPTAPDQAIPKDEISSKEQTEFWALAFFGSIALLISLVTLPIAFVTLYEIAKRMLRARPS